MKIRNTFAYARQVLGLVVGAALLACGTIQSGCAGEAARATVLGPVMAAAWPGVKEDAQLGLAARQNSQCAEALGIQVVSPGVAASRQERISQFDEAVRTFNREKTRD